LSGRAQGDLPRNSPARRHAAWSAAVAAAACLVPALAGCTTHEEPGEQAAAPPPDLVEPRAPRQDPGAPVSNGGTQDLPPAEMLAPALADASRRSGVAEADLVIEKSLRVTWNDGSLGCPQPGMSYTQALVPGWHLVIRAGERTFDYRGADRGRFMLCPPGRGQPPQLRDLR
jgi:hypothetical protein